MNSEKLANLVTRFPWVFIVLFVAITGFFAFQLPKSEMDTEMNNQLPPDLPTRINLDKIEQLFGGTDMVMIVVSSTDNILNKDTLERISKISKAMERVKELDRVVSLFTAKDISSDQGEMVVDKVVKRLPKNEEAIKALAERIKGNELVYGNLISRDFKDTAILGFLKPKIKDQELIDRLEQILKDNPGPEESYVAGMPVTRVSLAKDIRKDMRQFLPIGLALMVIFLFGCFRQVRGVALPFLITIMSIIVAMGLIPLLGWKIHTVTVLLPVILLAVANNYGIHIVSRYQEDNVPGNTFTARDLVKSGLLRLTYPVLATGITTIAGLLCLVSHIVIPAVQLGILAGVGTTFAMIGSITFIPSIVALLPKSKPILKTKEERVAASSMFDTVLKGTSDFIAAYPKTILLVALSVTVGLGLGAARIVVDTNPMSLYSQDHPIWRSTHLLNKKLGGWAGVSIVAKGDIQSPEVLREIDKLETHLKQNKMVSNTTSIAQVMRKMNQIMHDGDPAFDKIPESKELVAQYLLLYSMSASPEDFSKIVDFKYEHAQIIARVNDSGTAAATAVVKDIHDYLARNPKAPFPLVGGFVDVLSNMVAQIVKGQLLSVSISFVVIALLVMMLMRSIVAGLFSMVPLLLGTAVLFGVMGFFGIELNLVTAMLSSIMMGVGIDYSIHFMWRYRDERSAGADPNGAVLRTLITTGRGIVFNALSVVVGFSVLVISAFFPVRFFGLLTVVSIAACLIGAMVLMPAMAVVFKPKFLEGTKNN